MRYMEEYADMRGELVLKFEKVKQIIVKIKSKE